MRGIPGCNPGDPQGKYLPQERPGRPWGRFLFLPRPPHSVPYVPPHGRRFLPPLGTAKRLNQGGVPPRKGAHRKRSVNRGGEFLAAASEHGVKYCPPFSGQKTASPHALRRRVTPKMRSFPAREPGVNVTWPNPGGFHSSEIPLAYCDIPPQKTWEKFNKTKREAPQELTNAAEKGIIFSP